MMGRGGEGGGWAGQGGGRGCDAPADRGEPAARRDAELAGGRVVGAAARTSGYVAAAASEDGPAPRPPAPAGGGGAGAGGGGARTPPAAMAASGGGSNDARRPCGECAFDPRSAAAAAVAWRQRCIFVRIRIEEGDN